MRTRKFPLSLLIAVIMAAGLVGLFLSHTSAQQTRVIHLTQGWNLVSWTGDPQSASAALASLGDAVSVVYGYDNDSQAFTRCIVGRPEVSTLGDFEPEQAYWVLTQRSADWSVPGPAAPSCPTGTPCPIVTPCPGCPSTHDSQPAFCAGIKAGIEVDEVLLEIANAGLLVGPSGKVAPSEVETRLADSNQLFDIACQSAPLAEPSLLTSKCALAGKWRGVESTTMLYAPSAQYQVWADQFDNIIDRYCKPSY